jgi:hypothetical protein
VSTEHNDQPTYEYIGSLGEPLMSDEEFADLGHGEWAYIKALTSEEAKIAFPSVHDLPAGIDLFALLAADGTPLVLTDDEGTAISHAVGDDLEIATLH